MATFADSLTLAEFTGDDSLNGARGELLLESASAIIRNHCRQTFDLVEDDEVELRGTARSRLLLPERPVVSVASVTLDGDTLGADSYSRVRDGLWRQNGWGDESTLVQVTYTHGFAEGTPAMETLKAVCLQVAARAAANPQSFGGFDIDGLSASGLSAPIALTAAEQTILNRYRHKLASV